jgi:hypothetical protein
MEKCYRVKDERNDLHTRTLKRTKANWIGYNLRRNRLRKTVIDRKIKEREDKE